MDRIEREKFEIDLSRETKEKIARENIGMISGDRLNLSMGRIEIGYGSRVGGLRKRESNSEVGIGLRDGQDIEWREIYYQLFVITKLILIHQSCITNLITQLTRY